MAIRGTTKKKLQKTKTKAPIIGGAVLADSIGKTETQKSTAIGVFTVFWAWSFPCYRAWSVIGTIYNLKRGTSNVDIYVKKIGKSKKIKLGKINIQSIEDNSSAVFTAPLSHKFLDSGMYEVILSLTKKPDVHKTLFEIREREWPEFTSAETEFAKKNPAAVGSIRALIECPKCKDNYIFEEGILTNKNLSTGVKAFPKTGTIHCSRCKTKIELRDIQGQIRQTLKDRLASAMARK